jgi:F420H(2)-dependent quinone reductase
MANSNGFHGLMQQLASIRLGAWCFSKIQRQLDVMVLKLTGKYTATSILAGLPLVILQVQGAKTGKLRTVPLLCIGDDGRGDQFAVVASNWGQAHYPAWYRNLKANPEPLGTIKGASRAYLAQEAEGAEYDSYWQLAQQTYLGFSKYHSRIAGERPNPIMVLRAQ